MWYVMFVAGSASSTFQNVSLVATYTLAPPSAPTGVSATSADTAKVRVTWSAPSGATSYKVYRNTVNNSSTAALVGTPSGALYDDTTVTPLVTHYYWVKATNSGGDSAFSASAQGMRLAPSMAVTFDPNGGTPSSQNITQTYNTNYVLPSSAPTRTGYVFDGWFTATSGGTEVTASTKVTQTTAHTVYAQWTELQTMAVTFDPNGGTPTNTVTQTYNANYVLPSPDPTRTGYVFDGWFTASGGGTEVTAATKVTQTTAHTVYAQWTTAVLLGDYYVDASCPDDNGDGKSWATAKQTIQAAIDSAVAGNTIIVTNGTYTPISTSNKSIHIQSVNGAEWTIIDGGGINRCATLGSADNHTNTVLTGFTLLNGNADHANVGVGRDWGGGSYYGTLNNCTLTGNTASGSGGGSYYGSLYNCIVWENFVSSGTTTNYYSGTFNYSCTWPMPSGGIGNIDADPMFVDAANGDFHLRPNSQCVNAGNNADVVGDVDLDGKPRIQGGRVDMGAYESEFLPLGEAVNAPELEWTTGGDKPWFTQTAVTHNGPQAAQSGAIGDDEASWVETTVTGAGVFSFWWKVSSEKNSDFLILSTNGVEVVRISTEVGREQRVLAFTGGETTVRWTYAKDGDGAGGADCGWLDEVVWTPIYTLGEAVNAPELSWTTDGAEPWFVQSAVTHDTLHAAQSGAIGDDETSWIETTVTGGGVFSFWWKVSSEKNSDFLILSTNGMEAVRISTEVGWEQRVLEFKGGETTVRWTYAKDEDGAGGADCGWLDEVVWTPQAYTTGTPVNVPFDWLDQWGGHSGNYEALAKSKGANGLFYWESFVAGLIPTDANSTFAITNFVIKCDNGKDAVATLEWSPHRGDRDYKVWGKTNLTDGAWHSPTNDATRFFKVEVRMK